MGKVRVLIADDHRLFAKTIEALLAGDAQIEVVGIAEDGAEALRLVAALHPDVVLMDLDMPRVDGLTATRRLRDLGLGAKALVLTASNDPEDAERALAAGAAGYLTKDRVVRALAPAILDVAGLHARLSADGGADVAGRTRVG